MKIMTINVNITGMQRVSTSKKTVTQVLFDGTAEGEYFNGTILPGGVDTQIKGPEKGTLSARYMLEGKDNSGNNCKMYISNDAIQNSNITTPHILTDSENLRWLNEAELRGELTIVENGVQIEIFSKKIPIN